MKNIDIWTVGAVMDAVGVYQNDNTVVRVMNDTSIVVELCGNKIFYRDTIGRVYFTLAGWNTLTTRARLNALLSHFCNMEIYCKNKTAYIRGTCFDEKSLSNNIWYCIRAGVVEISHVQTI